MSGESFFELWVYLAATPLAGLTITMVAYVLGFAIYARAGLHPLANPVLIAVVLIVIGLRLGDVAYRSYFAGAQFVHFLLGPAVVGLAVPLARVWPTIRRLTAPIAISLVAGSAVALATAVGVAWALGASPATLASLAPKSITAPIAMGIAERIGGVAALAAVFAVATGIIGAALGKYVLDAMRVRDWRARGFAMGLTAHGIGTARAFQVNAEAGTYAGLAFGLHGVFAAFLLPLMWRVSRILSGSP